MKFKITWTDFFGAIFDLIKIVWRPLAVWIIWNMCIANDTIPKLDIIQVVSFIVIFQILISYINLNIKFNNAPTQSDASRERETDSF